MGDNPAENPIENVLGLLPPFLIVTGSNVINCRPGIKDIGEMVVFIIKPIINQKTEKI